MKTQDVVVVGGGVIGLAVAWRARRRGAAVTLLERGALASQTSHVAAGMLAPVTEAEAGQRAALELGLRGAALWPTFADELGEATGIDCGYRRTGSLVVARDRDEAEALEREALLRDELGVAVRRLLPSEARRHEPALAPTLRAALLAPDDHTADPRATCRALIAAARAAGVELREGCEVRALAPGRGVVLADGSFVHAATVVLAAGAWSAQIAGLPAPPPVRPLKGQTVRLRPRPGDATPLLTGVVRYDGGYLVPRDDGRIVVGATTEDRGFDTAMTAGGVHDLLRDAAELVPGVLELEVEELLAGLRPTTPDNAPLIGELADGVLAACGHHRNGVLLAPVTAELVVAQLEGAAVGVGA